MSALRVIGCLVVLCAVIGQIESKLRQCDNDRLTCAGKDVKCDRATGNCKCAGSRYGLPHLGCFREKFKICHMINDPKGKNLARQPEAPIDLSMPCGYLLAQWKSRGKANNGNRDISCAAKVYATQTRIVNKFYISGISVDMTLTKTSPGKKTFTENLKLDVSGEARWGKYSFNMWRDGVKSKGDNVDLKDMKAKFGKMKFSVRDDNKVGIDVEACGLLLYFRPAEKSRTVWEQRQQPGVVLGLNKGNNKINYVAKHSFCLTARSDGPTVDNVKDEFNFHSYEDAFLYRAFMSKAPADLPGLTKKASGACVKAITAVKKCKNQNVDQLPDAMKTCGHLLRHSPFIKCYSNSKDSRDLVNLFKDCMKCTCEGEEDRCKRAMKYIEKKGCQAHITSTLTPIMA